MCLKQLFYRTSIEILPGGVEQWAPQATDNFPFVLVDGHLGIPQKLLYKLYMAAVASYKNVDQITALTLSSVILLVNPAHQTVLNARKKLIYSRTGLLQPEEELKLIALLIGGSKECAKQSIIWDHRRWIFKHHYERIGDAVVGPGSECTGWATSEEASFFPMIPLDTLGKECELIRKACEMYPRNYHAWTHYHWALGLVNAVVTRDWGVASANLVEDHVRFLRQEVMQLRQWIDRHVSDYSAVHLLCNVAVLDHTGAPQLAQCGRGTLVDELREHVLGLVLSYPSHETLWLYLRNVLTFSSSDVTREVVNSLRSREEMSAAVEKYIANLL
jgi:protein prenyltransferase alpha subunit repeat containing protein 1